MVVKQVGGGAGPDHQTKQISQRGSVPTLRSRDFSGPTGHREVAAIRSTRLLIRQTALMGESSSFVCRLPFPARLLELITINTSF